MKDTRCRGCGAELQPGPDCCPLCGSPAPRPKPRKSRRGAPSVEDYQSDVRDLREQLKKLRDGGAEAV
jgi:predicted amidophosphoribosyltransferase